MKHNVICREDQKGNKIGLWKRSLSAHQKGNKVRLREIIGKHNVICLKDQKGNKMGLRETF